MITVKSPILKRFLTVFYVLFAGCASDLSATDNPNRPNLLFIVSDQYRYDLMRFVQDEMPRYDGKTKIRTPNLDRLAGQGVYFKNAYTQCPVCGPARSSLRTGCTLERHGQQTNDLYKESSYTKDPVLFQNKIEANVTFDQILAEDKNYSVEHYGKWHMPDIYYWTKDGSAKIMQYNDADFSAMTSPFDLDHLIFEFDDQYYVFDYDKLLSPLAQTAGYSKTEVNGQQENTYSKYPYWPDGIDARYGLAPGAAAGSQSTLMGKDILPAEMSSTYFEGVAALGALDRLVDQTNAFAVTASFHCPHPPFIAPDPHYSYYKARQDTMQLPDSLSGADTANSAYGTNSDPDFQDPDKVQEWMVSYYSLCEEVDEYVGLLLDKLDEKGIADNTLVIFVGDHGEMLGGHGTDAKSKFWEEAAHIPLLIRYPGQIQAGVTVEEPVTTMDCFSTILDYLDASAYDNSDGSSLRRHIERRNYNQDYDDEVIVIERDFRDPDGSGGLLRTFGGEPNFLCVKGPWKLMMTKNSASGLRDVLHNVETDPYEMVNYLGDNGMTASDEIVGKTEHLKCLLLEWMERNDGPNYVFSDPVFNAGEGDGDIAEITQRRTWKALNIWVCDTDIEVGLPVDVGGQLTRNEYIYFGRTTPGTLNVSSVTVQGADAGWFQLSGFTNGVIASGEYGRAKLTYLPSTYGQPINDARIVIENDAGADKVIELSAEPLPNEAPEITAAPVTEAEIYSPYTYALIAVDAEGDPMMYSSGTLPGWLSFNTNSAVLSGTPSYDDIGLHPIELTVRDATGSIKQNFTLKVSKDGNIAPVFTSSPSVTGLMQNRPYAYLVSAVDYDGNALTLGAATLPSWLTFDADEGLLSGLPEPTDVGVHLVELTADDGTVAVTQAFNIAVFTASAASNENIALNPSFEDGGASLTYWDLDAFASGSADRAHDGSASLKLTTTFDGGRAEQVVGVQPDTDYEISFWIDAGDMTAGGIRLLIEAGGSGLYRFKIDAGSAWGWTPYTATVNSGANSTVKIRTLPKSGGFVGAVYFDNIQLISLAPSGNNAPVITSVPDTDAQKFLAYEYVLTAVDAEGGFLAYSSVTKPAWLSFNADTGVLSGTPGPGDVGSHPVTLRVDDGEKTDEQSFSIEVTQIGSTGYNAWADGQAEMIGVPERDNDHDGRINLYEYALGGNPTHAADGNIDPVITNAAGEVQYRLKQRHGDSSLTYTVEVRTNLVSGSWTEASLNAITNGVTGDYDDVSYIVPSTNSQTYLRLKLQGQ